MKDFAKGFAVHCEIFAKSRRYSRMVPPKVPKREKYAQAEKRTFLVHLAGFLLVKTPQITNMGTSRGPVAGPGRGAKSTPGRGF